jgi:hypothetical protein
MIKNNNTQECKNINKRAKEKKWELFEDEQ